MKVINFAEQQTVVNRYMSELRDVCIQKDRARFRRNLERIGEVMAYEISKTLDYSVKDIQTPLGTAPTLLYNDLNGKTLIIADPMLATGGSMELGLKAFETKGIPGKVHLCSAIASRKGVDYLTETFKDTDYTLWCGAIDPELNDHMYIVPGLGDAGDLAYGGKL